MRSSRSSTTIGTKDPQAARAYCAKEFADYRRKKPTPYMDGLRFKPHHRSAADPDTRILSDQDLQAAVEEGKRRAKQCDRSC